MGRSRQRLLATLSAHRWPALVFGLLALSVTANGVLVYVATRPDAPLPIEDFYRRSQRWDAEQAEQAASRQLGWTVRFSVPGGPPYTLLERRPVDVVVRDRQGRPVTGLHGRLLALRPADTSLNGASPLTELPHAPGSYRSLARLPVPGLWQLSLDAHRDQTPFTYSARVRVDGEARP